MHSYRGEQLNTKRKNNLVAHIYFRYGVEFSANALATAND